MAKTAHSHSVGCPACLQKITLLEAENAALKERVRDLEREAEELRATGKQLDTQADIFGEKIAALESQLVEAKKLFTKHTSVVELFLNEVYAIMVDPCAEGTGKVKETCEAILTAATSDRQRIYDLDQQLAAKDQKLNKAGFALGMLQKLIHSEFCIPLGCEDKIDEKDQRHCSACKNAGIILRDTK